jgi:hypothetical protein
MFLLVLAAVLFASFFVIVLPGGVLVAAVLVNLRRSPKPEVQLCLASDVTDPAAKPCFVYEGTRFCPRHRLLEQAS